jgi:hypothetical protein
MYASFFRLVGNVYGERSEKDGCSHALHQATFPIIFGVNALCMLLLQMN